MWMRKSIVSTVARIGAIAVLSTTFLFAGIAKFTMRSMDGETAPRTLVERCGTVASHCAPVIGALEPGVAAALWWRAASRWAIPTAIALLAGFSGTLVRELFAKHPLPCGCFGSIGAADGDDARRSLTVALARNSALLVCAVMVYGARGNVPRVQG